MSPQSSIGHYRIVSKLGEGGMGAVFRATDTKLNRDVAIKMLPDSFAADPDRLARFGREAQVLAALNHPHIAQIYGVEERALVLELVDGPTLDERIAQGPLPVAEALEIAVQIADALEAAHEKGIIHRDLKPANIKLTSEGRVKVLDFGLAKAIAGDPSGVSTANSPTLTMRATEVGIIIGTAAYMSPEQAAGKSADRRADIWSFGVVLCEMLSGRRLFEAETTSLILADVLRAPISLEHLPEETPEAVRRLLGRCLDRNPRSRLRDIGEARVAIQSAGSEPASAAIAPAPVVVRKTSWVWPAIAAASLLLSGGLLVRGWKPGGPAAAAMAVRSTLELTPAESLSNDGRTRPHQTSMAFSPDGNILVFSGTVGQTRQLYKRALDQAEAVAIPGTEGGFGPFFSPDGQWIGFFTNTEIKKVSANGGPAVVLFATGSAALIQGATWGADNRIVTGGGDLTLISEQGGDRKILLAADPARQAVYSSPEFLPDGKTLLFSTVAGEDWEHSEISVLPEGGPPRVLVKGGASPRYAAAGYLLFMRRGTLMAAPFELSSLKVTGAAVPLVAGVMQAINSPFVGLESGIGQFAVSRVGALAYVKGGIYPALRGSWVRIDRSGAITNLDWAGSAGYGRISPDGRRMVAMVQASTTSRATRLEVYDLERQTSVRLTDDAPTFMMPPAWSPDGQRIVVRSGTKLESVSVDGQGTRTTLLDAKEAPQVAAWSPDGKLLAYTIARPGLSQVWVAPMPGPGESRLFLESKSRVADLEFSPDGKWLTYSSGETGRMEVYVQAFSASGEKHRISKEGGTNPAWSRDGRELFYLERKADAPESENMMAVAIETGSGWHAGMPRLLFVGPRISTVPSRSYDVYPDGRHFLVNHHGIDAEPPVTRLQFVWNWFEELKRRVPAGER